MRSQARKVQQNLTVAVHHARQAAIRGGDNAGSVVAALKFQATYIDLQTQARRQVGNRQAVMAIWSKGTSL